MQRTLKVNKTNLTNIVLFCISPILSFPFLLTGIYNKRNRVSLILLLLFAALIMYQLEPGFYLARDLFELYRFYNYSLDWSFQEFIKVLFTKPDFVVHICIYMCAKIGISGQVLFTSLTFITLYLIYTTFEKIVKERNVPNSYYLLGIITIFMSFELLGLYSGIRNLLAASIAIHAFYIGHFEDRKRKGLLIFSLAILTHFSIIIFLPVYIFGIMYPISKKLGFGIYLASFLFLLVSKQNLYDFASSFPLPDAIDAKIRAYLLGLDSLEESFIESKSAYISYLIRISWIYFAQVYILITYKRESSFRFIIILLMCLLNFFSMTTDVLLRLTYLIQPLFIFFIFYELNYKYNKTLILIFTLLIIPNFIINIMVYRDYLIDSLFNSNALTLIGILMKKFEPIFLW